MYSNEIVMKKNANQKRIGLLELINYDSESSNLILRNFSN